MPGDRRDEDIIEAAAIVAGHFDHYVCRRDDRLRGRAPDEVPRILKEALLKSGVDETAITVIEEEEKAVDGALKMAEPNDLVLIFADNITRSWKQIIYFGKDHEEIEAEEQKAQILPTPPKPKPAVKDLLAAATPVEDAPQVPESVLADGTRLVRDERGVRLADSYEEESD